MISRAIKLPNYFQLQPFGRGNSYIVHEPHRREGRKIYIYTQNVPVVPLHSARGEFRFVLLMSHARAFKPVSFARRASADEKARLN